MAPKSANSSTCKDGVKLGLERFKKNEVQHVKVNFIKTHIKTLSSLIDILSEGVTSYMVLLTASRYYALNDRTIHFLSQGEIDMSATTAESGSTPASNTVSDADVVALLDSETEVEMFVVGSYKTRQGDAFFKYLDLTLSNLGKYVLFKTIDTINITVCS